MKRSALRTWFQRLAMAGVVPFSACANQDRAGDAAMQHDLKMVDAQPLPPDCSSPPYPGPCAAAYFLDGGTPTDGYLSGFAACNSCCYFLTPPEKPGMFCGPPACAIEPTVCGMVLVCGFPGCDGRRPAGLAPDHLKMSDKMAEHFARMAHLEAASVPAFVRLVDELTSHGADAWLIASARRAILDEERHFAMMSSIANRLGAPVPAVEVEPFRERSLVDMAIENAVEGCVRESAGVIAALQQAKASPDRQLASMLTSIAIDEQRHADLAWAVHAWLTPQLTAAENERVRTAMQGELRAMLRERSAA